MPLTFQVAILISVSDCGDEADSHLHRPASLLPQTLSRSGRRPVRQLYSVADARTERRVNQLRELPWLIPGGSANEDMGMIFPSICVGFAHDSPRASIMVMISSRYVS
jgi:hypothetical protein